MKKTMLLLVMVAVVMCCFVSQALAFPFESESEDVAVYSYGYPGGLKMKEADTQTYDSFCIQKEIPIWNSYDNKGNLVRPYNVESVGTVTLKDNTKWLYAAYHEGIFNDISESSLRALNLQNATTQAYEISDLGLAVQYGIWHIQQGNQDTRATAAWDLFDDYLQKTNWNTFAKKWDIRSIKLSLTRNDGGYTSMQTQIVGTEVPEPATMALMGFGLLGFAGAVKRRRAQIKE